MHVSHDRTELEARSQVVVSAREVMRLQQERDTAVGERQELFRSANILDYVCMYPHWPHDHVSLSVEKNYD